MRFRGGTVRRAPRPRGRPSPVPCWQMASRPHRRCGLLLLCSALGLLGACAGVDKPKPVLPITQSVLQAPGRTVLTVSDRNDGAAVMLETAQELRVDLQLSAWEVANNFDWSLADLKTGMLDPIGSRFERSGRDTNPTESGGSTLWRLKPSGPGRVTLAFALRRPYSTGPSLKTVSFDVTVK